MRTWALRRAASLGALALAGAALSACATTSAAPRRSQTAHRAPAPTSLTRSALARASSAAGAGSSASTTTNRPATSAVPPSTTTTAVPASTIGTTPPSVAPTATTVPSAPGFVAGRVTAIGDSVMLDYASNLEADLPHLSVDLEAAVSRQFSDGIALAQQLRAAHQLGATVIVALGTNGTVTPQELSAMAAAVSGASLIVFVTVHVDQPWQAEVNATLRAGAPGIPHAVIADWATLASGHPRWFYSDGTHLPIGGPGAQALARLVAEAVLTRSSD